MSWCWGNNDDESLFSDHSLWSVAYEFITLLEKIIKSKQLVIKQSELSTGLGVWQMNHPELE